jgi:hypothetical protein
MSSHKHRAKRLETTLEAKLIILNALSRESVETLLAEGEVDSSEQRR